MKKLLYIVLIYLFFTSIGFTAGNSGNDGVGSIEPKTSIAKPPKKISVYKQAEKRILKAKKLEKKGKNQKAQKLYQEALNYLYKANKVKPFDPDILNYLGFANRKTNNFEDAEIYYLMGLEIDPKHIGINEYLGELYVATNRVNLAKERLEILKNCNCKEYQELKDVIDGNKSSKY